MKKLTTIISLIALATILFGCVTNQPQVSLPTSKTYDAPKSAVWPLVVAKIAEKYPVKVIEKESGIITTDFVSIPVGFNNSGSEQFIRPPGGFLATWNGLRMSMSVLVTEPENGKTLVTFNTHYEAFENNVSRAWIVCVSNGYIENDILESVSGKLTAATAAK